MLKFLPKGPAAALAVCLGAAAAALAVCVAGAAAALPAFTTAPKTSPGRGDAAELYDVAAACHAGFDRFVIRARFATPGYDVRYVRRIVYDPSGRPVALAGATRIRARFSLAGGHDSRGTNLLAGELTPRCPNLLEVKKAG